MKGCPGMVAVVLDQTTQLLLATLAVHENVFCSHITMAYRPTPEVYKKYADLLGQEVEFNIVASVIDDKGQAVVVEGVPSEKAVPHVTISCREGIKPSYSNDLLSNPECLNAATRTWLQGRGVVQYRSL